jgi:hypothetical protein
VTTVIVALFIRLTRKMGLKSTLMLTLLGVGALWTLIMQTMFYPGLALSFAMPIAVWSGVASSRQRLLYPLRRQNIAMLHALRDTIPIQNLVKEINCIFGMPNPITDFCITCHEDNLLAIAMAESLKFTPRTKHIAIEYHHFRNRVQTSFNKSGDIKIKYISTKLQLANILTKPLDSDAFFRFCNMLCGW